MRSTGRCRARTRIGGSVFLIRKHVITTSPFRCGVSYTWAMLLQGHSFTRSTRAENRPMGERCLGRTDPIHSCELVGGGTGRPFYRHRPGIFCRVLLRPTGRTPRLRQGPFGNCPVIPDGPAVARLCPRIVRPARELSGPVSEGRTDQSARTLAT